MERFLLLWDEIDEIMGYGRHIAVGIAHSVSRRARRVRSLMPAYDRVG